MSIKNEYIKMAEKIGYELITIYGQKKVKVRNKKTGVVSYITTSRLRSESRKVLEPVEVPKKKKAKKKKVEPVVEIIEDDHED